jgi:hypothetical protein
MIAHIAKMAECLDEIILNFELEIERLTTGKHEYTEYQ